MSDLVQIDGSAGEGGGQVLRTSLALSLVTGRPFRIERIRAGRKKPGLMRQHLTSVEAAARVGGARVEGAAISSTELTFRPAVVTAAGGTPAVTPGAYSFSVGTAGSTTLVLQTVLPALLTASGPSTLTLSGGTHNPMAPPFDFLARSFLPLIARMGPRVEVSLTRHGFYPAGGGELKVTVEPATNLSRLELLTRGEVTGRRARALVARLPREIGERELAVVRARLGWESLWVEDARDSVGPGNVLVLEISSSQVTEVVTGFGEKGIRAEAVAEKGVEEARRYLAADVPVGEHLADQLLVPLAMSREGGMFRTLPPSRHATTNAEVIHRFLETGIRFTKEGRTCVVEVG